MQKHLTKSAARFCSVAASLRLLGDRWSLLILRSAFFGMTRFDDFLRSTGCARNILTDRLRSLVAAQILERVPYKAQGARERYEYRLMEKGLDLFPVVMALMQWGDQWVAGPEGPPVEVIDRTTGLPLRVVLTSSTDVRSLALQDVIARPGPGMPAAEADAASRGRSKER